MKCVCGRLQRRSIERRVSQLHALPQSALLVEVSGPEGRRLRQQLASAREQLQALAILTKVRLARPLGACSTKRH